ncbi:MAG: GLPGLI family protein [Capnocytophaga sp.]|nr:GLPGLI family protein [Capnocytophaga sp.]
MKKILFILYLLVSFYNYAQEDEKMIKITYIKQPFLSPEGDFETFLYVTENKAQYVFPQKERTVKKDNYKMSLPFFKYINNYDFNTQEVEENRVLKDSTKLYAHWKNNLVWEITDEEKEINGYKVRKATTDSFEIESDDEYYYGKAIAWFATDIPLPLGPARYYGLPGLIVKLSFQNSKNVYLLKNIEYTTTKDYTFVELNKDNLVEKEDVIYFFHKNPDKVKEIQKNRKKNKK